MQIKGAPAITQKWQLKPRIRFKGGGYPATLYNEIEAFNKTTLATTRRTT